MARPAAAARRAGSAPALFVGGGQPAERAALRHRLRPADGLDRLGRGAGRAGLRLQLGAAAADRPGRRRRLRRGGPARHLAAPAGRRPLHAPDLRRQGAGQRDRDPAARRRSRRLRRGRRAACRWATARSPGSTATRSAAPRRRPLRRSPGSACWRRPRRSRPSGCSAPWPSAARRWGCCCPAVLAVVLALVADAAAAARGAARAARARPSSPGAACSPSTRRPGPCVVGVVVALVWAVGRDRGWPTGCSCGATSPTWRTTGPAAGSCSAGLLPLAALTAACRPWSWPLAARPAAPASTRPSWSARSRRRTGTSTGCRPTSCTGPPSPRRSCRPPRPATRAARSRPTRARAPTGAASSRGTCPAPPRSGRPSTSSTSPPDGRYVADGDGPKEVNGFFQVRTPHGDAPNPLWQFDGTVDLLQPPRKD